MTARRLLSGLFAPLLLGLAAAPAQATLLVRADGNGLFMQDKNGLVDIVTINSLGGGSAYRIESSNFTDVFDYDFQAGCRRFGALQNREASCDRNGPIANFVMNGGDDLLQFAGVPAGTVGANMGSGNDTFHGQAGRDNAHGLSGNDEVRGGDSNDNLDGGDGEDRVFGDKGSDDVDGDANADHVEGNDGNDTVAGSSGSDAVLGGLGTDAITGGSGNDFVDSKEPSGSGVKDSIGCGDGSDFLQADLADSIPSTCEDFDQSPVGETPHVRIQKGTLRVRSSGRARIRLRCPRGVGSLGCKGRLSLRLDRRGARRARKRYKIRAGHSKTVTVRLSRGSVRSLRRRQRRGRRTRAVLASVEKGRLGRKTTARNPRLRLR